MRYITYLVILLMLGFSGIARSAPLIGQDYLALQHSKFNISRAVQYHTTGTPVGALDTTFGTDASKVRSFISRVQPRFFRVHIFNVTCVRNRNCGSYEPLHGYTLSSLNKAAERKDKELLSKLKKRVTWWKSIAGDYPDTYFLLSHSLEHSFTKKAWRNLADAVLSVWPEVKLINSPVGGVSIEKYKGAWIERHGASPSSDADITSLDGADATDIDLPKYLLKSKGAKIAFIWSTSFNCRLQGVWEDPRERTHCPTGQQFELLAHIGDDKVQAPFPLPSANCKKVGPFKSPWIWKPFAEYAPNDRRSLRPVAITGYKQQDLRVINFEGKLIGRMPYYGTYGSNLYRAYSGGSGGSNLGGYEMEKESYRLGLTHGVWIKSESGNCNGPIFPSRRNGDYR